MIAGTPPSEAMPISFTPSGANPDQAFDDKGVSLNLREGDSLFCKGWVKVAALAVVIERGFFVFSVVMPRLGLGIHEFRAAWLGATETNSWIPRPSPRLSGLDFVDWAHGVDSTRI